MSGWKRGDVVQISPEHDVTFGGAFMLVLEPKAWGAMGFVAIPAAGGEPPRQAWYRAPTEALTKIGTAEWMPAPDPREEEDDAD